MLKTMLKSLAILMLLAVAALASRQAEARDAPQFEEIAIPWAGASRYYLLHMPRGAEEGKPLPLVLALHGGGGSAAHMAREQPYGLAAKSDEAGFILVLPNGSSRFPGGKLATWNAGNCCAYARDQGVDDVGFLKAVVADVARQHAIDRKRVYAIGMSNGAMMAYRLACEAADTFTAIMAVAGTDNTAACAPSVPVSVLHVHALDDDHVLFNGGIGPSAVSRHNGVEFRSVPETVNAWKAHNRCSGKPRRIRQVAGAYCDLFEDCAGGSHVQLCVTEKGGHSWPGGSKRWGWQEPSQALRANDLMWEFFSR